MGMMPGMGSMGGIGSIGGMGSGGGLGSIGGLGSSGGLGSIGGVDSSSGMDSSGKSSESQAGSGQTSQGSLPLMDDMPTLPFPFQIPGFPGMGSDSSSGSASSSGGPGLGLGLGTDIGKLADDMGTGLGTEEEQIVQETQPDGSVCQKTIISVNGKVKSEKKRCSQPQWNRRLQPMLIPVGFDDTMGQDMAEDTGDDLWVLGGVFLERFVTIFDFDEGKIGFAEPSAAVGQALDDAVGLAKLRGETEIGDIGMPDGDIRQATRQSGSPMIAIAVGACIVSATAAVAYATLRAQRDVLRETNLAMPERADDVELAQE